MISNINNSENKFRTFYFLCVLSGKQPTAKPRTVMPLWKANLEEPITDQSDISVMIIVNESTSNFLLYFFICCSHATSCFVDDDDWTLFWWIVLSRWRQRLKRRNEVYTRKSVHCLVASNHPLFISETFYLRDVNRSLYFICSCVKIFVKFFLSFITETHLRLAPSTKGDEQQLKWFCDACKGIPQVLAIVFTEISCFIS